MLSLSSPCPVESPVGVGSVCCPLTSMHRLCSFLNSSCSLDGTRRHLGGQQLSCNVTTSSKIGQSDFQRHPTGYMVVTRTDRLGVTRQVIGKFLANRRVGATAKRVNLMRKGAMFDKMISVARLR